MIFADASSAIKTAQAQFATVKAGIPAAPLPGSPPTASSAAPAPAAPPPARAPGPYAAANAAALAPSFFEENRTALLLGGAAILAGALGYSIWKRKYR
jgi:hypothetical protein